MTRGKKPKSNKSKLRQGVQNAAMEKAGSEAENQSRKGPAKLKTSSRAVEEIDAKAEI